MKRNQVSVIVSASVLAVLSLITFYLYFQGTREALSQFQERQLSYARHLSTEIQFFLEARTQALRTMVSYVSLHGFPVDLQRLHREAGQMDRVHVKALSFYDNRGRAVYSTDGSIIGRDESQSEFFLLARSSENQSKVSLMVDNDPTSLRPLRFILSTPVYRESRERMGSGGAGAGPVFVGVLSYTLDIKSFLVNQSGSDGGSTRLDQVWILGKDGTLLFLPEHPEMVLRNIHHRGSDCGSCHDSFQYVEEMLFRKRGTADYQVKGYPRKIAAFAAMDFADASWVVVVNSPYGRVSGFVLRSLRDHLPLFGVIVLALVAGSVLIIRNERMRIKAEERELQWRERLAERKKAEEVLQTEQNKLKESEERYRVLVETLRESEKQLRHLSAQLFTAQETERKRISRELHDELGQALTALKLHMGYIEKNLGKEQAQLRKECEDGIEHIDQIIEDVRRLSRDLSPMILEDFGLSAGIRWLVNNLAKKYNIKVALDMTEIDSLIPRESHTMVYRIVQEGLTNIAKHAEAGHVSISIKEDTGTVSLTLTDDGKGFDMAELAARGPEEKGLGLVTMAGRVRMLKGALTIRSEPGKGTKVAVIVPAGGGILNLFASLYLLNPVGEGKES